MSDDVKLNISFDDGGGGNSSKNPFAGIKALSKEDLQDAFPQLDNFKEIFASLKEITPEDFLNTKEIGKSIEQIFKDLPTLDQKDAIYPEMAGFLPDDFEEQLDNFFATISEHTKSIEEEDANFQRILEEGADSIDALAAEIGGTIATISAWATGIVGAVAAIGAFVVATELYSAFLKETLNSLGEFAGQFRAEQAMVQRDLTLQSLRNSRRLDEQLAGNEALRGELAGQLEQFKTELFDLLSPVIRFITVTLTGIMAVLNAILGALNLIKDVLLTPFTLIGNLLSIIASDASDNMRRKNKNDRDRKNPGLGSAIDLFEMDNVGRTTQDLPPGMFNDQVKHPFDFDGLGGEADPNTGIGSTFGGGLFWQP